MTFSLVQTSKQQLYRTAIKIDGPMISSNHLTLTIIIVVVVVLFFHLFAFDLSLLLEITRKIIIIVTDPAPVHDILMAKAINVVVMH